MSLLSTNSSIQTDVAGTWRRTTAAMPPNGKWGQAPFSNGEKGASPHFQPAGIQWLEVKNLKKQKGTSAMTENQNTLTDAVKPVLERIRGFLQQDGGDIELVSVDEATGVVSVRLKGACSGCMHAQATLKDGVERHLKEKVPAVKEVVAVR